MEYPGGKKQHFPHLLFFAFHRGQKAAEAARDICMAYGEDVKGKSTARKWFAKFKNGNFDINDTPHSERPSEFDEDHLKALLKEESGGGGFTRPIPRDGGADQFRGISIVGRLPIPRNLNSRTGPEVQKRRGVAENGPTQRV